MAAAAQLHGVIVASRTEDHACATVWPSSAAARLSRRETVRQLDCRSCRLLRKAGDFPNRRVQVRVSTALRRGGPDRPGLDLSGRIGALQQSHHVLQDKNPTPVGYQSCGMTANMAIHLVFEAMSLLHGFELPCSVQALRFAAPHYDDRAGEGANVVHTFCTWADGTVAHLWGSRINSSGYDNGFKVIGTEGRIDVGEFVGDFGAITARLGSGAGDDRGRQIEDASFPMTRPSARHPDSTPGTPQPMRPRYRPSSIVSRETRRSIWVQSSDGKRCSSPTSPRRERAIRWSPIRPHAGRRIRDRDS